MAMSLLYLPPEILIRVLDYVGSSYFREDIGRLTVCKQWFPYARATRLKELGLSEKTLHRVLSRLDVESHCVEVRDYLESLEVGLEGFTDWASLSKPEYYPFRYSGIVSVWHDERRAVTRLDAWNARLHDDLLRLAGVAKQCRKLRELRIRVWSEQCPGSSYPSRGECIRLRTISALLVARDLTVLELDLCGNHAVQWRRNSMQPKPFHICPIIGGLLSTLRRLRLRMRCICTKALKPKEQEAVLGLREVIVNLSLGKESSLITAAAHSAVCHTRGEQVFLIVPDFEAQAKALAERMADPKVVRILTHVLPNFEMRSFDVVTGRRMKLADGAAWDDDGPLVEATHRIGI